MENTLLATGDTVNGQSAVIVDSLKPIMVPQTLPVDPDAFRATERIFPLKVHEVVSEKESLHIIKTTLGDHTDHLIEVGLRLQGLEKIIVAQSNLIASLTSSLIDVKTELLKIRLGKPTSNSDNRELHQMD